MCGALPKTYLFVLYLTGLPNHLFGKNFALLPHLTQSPHPQQPSNEIFVPMVTIMFKLRLLTIRNSRCINHYPSCTQSQYIIHNLMDRDLPVIPKILNVVTLSNALDSPAFPSFSLTPSFGI